VGSVGCVDSAGYTDPEALLKREAGSMVLYFRQMFRPMFVNGIRAALVLFLAQGLLVNVAWAQSVPKLLPPVPLQGSLVNDSIEAEFAFQEALLAFENRNYSKALELLDTIPKGSSAVEYQRGLCLVRLKNYTAAVAVFDALQDDPNLPAELKLDASIAQLKAGQVTRASAGLAALVDQNPNDGQTRFFHAVALYEQGESDVAAQQMNWAVAQDTALEPYREIYRDYDQRLGPAAMSQQSYLTSPAQDRRWNLSFIYGVEYDTNVPQTPRFSGLGSNFDREDSRVVLGLFGDYRFIQEEDQVLGVFASANTNINFDISELNVQTYSGGAYWNKAAGDWLMGVNYQFGETLLDAQQFASSHRITPSITYRGYESGHTTAYYEFEDLELDVLALIPAQIRSGTTSSVGATHAVYLGPENLGRLFLGYRFGNTSADGSDFDMTSNMLSARIEYPLQEDLVFDVGARFFFDDYGNANSLDFFDRSREDQRVEVRTGLQKYLNENVSVRVDYTFVESDSNVANLFGVEFYSYRRHVLSALLIYDF
jgi:tetratricopeptide (TPR) repeat protein